MEKQLKQDCRSFDVTKGITIDEFNDKYKKILQNILKICSNFVKINQSCIVNVNKIERFDTSVSGTLKVSLKNGYTDYVSRRQLKPIKERIGI